MVVFAPPPHNFISQVTPISDIIIYIILTEIYKSLNKTIFMG
jgi:hypothetical protein